MEHVLAKTILITKIIELIANESGIPIEEARDRFFKSKTISLVEDDDTGLYGESPLYVFSLYQQENS